MCCDENNNCIGDLLKRIALLQKQDCDNNMPSGCDKPFLGPIRTFECYNTRPISLFNCCNGNAWSFPYTLNDVVGESTIFRIEALDNCCCTCRVLATDAENQLVTTNDFFTLDLNCVGAIKCLPDVFIELC